MAFIRKRILVGFGAVLLAGLSIEVAAEDSKSDVKKVAKRAAQCEAIFHRLKFRKLALSEDTQQKKAVDENWKFWSTRSLEVTPKDKFKKYQKKARKAVIQNGATNAVVKGCAQERSLIMVEQLQSNLFGGAGLNGQLAEASRLQKIESAKPENVVFCKHMADRLLSFHTKDAAEFDKQPSKFVVADAKAANDAYDALSSEQRQVLEADAQVRVGKTFSNGELKTATNLCMPGYFMKTSRVVSPLEKAKKRKAEREAAK